MLQVAASGGTFPIEMTPSFFQRIHPLLPFTYAIGALREVQFGMVYSDLLKDLATLMLWPLCVSVLVLALGPRLIRVMEKNERSMKKSGLH